MTKWSELRTVLAADVEEGTRYPECLDYPGDIESDRFVDLGFGDWQAVSCSGVPVYILGVDDMWYQS